MAKSYAKRFYDSRAWARCRDSYIAQRRVIDGGMCEKCHNQIGYIVHHRVMLTPENINDSDISLNHELLEYVCKECHDKEEGHGVGKKNVPAVCAFDDKGNVVGILPPFERDRL